MPAYDSSFNSAVRRPIASFRLTVPFHLIMPAMCGLFVAVVAGCAQDAVNDAAAGSQAAPPIQGEVLTIQQSAWPTIVRTQGSLFADEVAVVGAKVAGRIAEVHVELGDVIQAGDPLVALDQEEFRLQVAQAEAQLQQARAATGLRADDPLETLEPENAPLVREAKAIWDEARTKRDRARQLSTKKTVSQAELEQMEAAEQVAAAQHASAINSVHEKIALIAVREAELSLARQRVADAVIPAPFDGLVEERHVAPGAFVQIGMPIVTLVRDHPLHFRGKMPERHARRLRIGQEVRLHVEAVAQPRTVKVTRISPTLDLLSRSLLFEAKVENADGRLWAGIFAEADVVIDSDAETVVVPESAVAEFAGVEKVWQVVDGAAREQIVLTGERRDGRIEIVEGLAPGDSILLDAKLGRVAQVDPTTPDLPPARALPQATDIPAADIPAADTQTTSSQTTSSQATSTQATSTRTQARSSGDAPR